MSKQSELHYPSRWAILRRVAATAAAVAGVIVLPGVAAVVAATGAVLLASNLVHTADLRASARRADPEKARAFRELVLEECQEAGIAPPRQIFLLNPSRKSFFLGNRVDLPNAFAARLRGLGHGRIMATESLMDNLNSDEVRSTVQHEISHYRHADSRISQTFHLSTVATGTAAVVTAFSGGGALILPALLLANATFTLRAANLAASRRRESRCDREAIRNPHEAEIRRSSLLKSTVVARRHFLERDQPRFRLRNLLRRNKPDAFGEPPQTPLTDEQIVNELLKRPTLLQRLDHIMVGRHPIFADRIRDIDALAQSNNSRAPVARPAAAIERPTELDDDIAIPRELRPVPERRPAGEPLVGAAAADMSLTSRFFGRN